MIQALFGEKKDQTQTFLENGDRIPVTVLCIPKTSIAYQKTKEKDGYWAVQLGFHQRKHPTQALLGHIKGAGLETAPRFLREVRINEEALENLPKKGEVVSVSSVFKPGDIVDVVGVSKGKGFAGGVKRHHFKGGPRTHGQSDRERAPGSIGQSTTPGRVYRGKRMAGHMGNVRVTVKNLLVMQVDDATGDVLIKGLVPGSLGSIVRIVKTGEMPEKKFVPLLNTQKDEEKDQAPKEQQPISTETPKAKNQEDQATEKKNETTQEVEKGEDNATS